MIVPQLGTPTTISTLAGSVLLFGLVSFGFFTVAVFEYSPASIALEDIAFTTISGKDAPTTRFSVRVHENDRLPFAQDTHVHPAPTTLPVMVNPFGMVSSTVVVPVAVAGPSFRTTNR